MFKALLKKDLAALLVAITMDRRKGTKRSTAGIILMALLFVFVFASLAGAFFSYSLMIADAVSPGSWLYMSLIGCFGLVLGLFGSVFTTYGSIYKAKDNELLLSLPIPQGTLLASKMVKAYLMSLLFCTLGMLPGYVYAWIEHAVPPISVVLSILTIIFQTLMVTALSCILAWVVALVVGLFPNKNAATVIFSLLFLFLYYTIYFKMMSSLQEIMGKLDAFGEGIKGYAYPIYKMGQGAAGDAAAFGIFAAICVVVFAVVYFVMSRSFIRIATRSEKQHTRVYVEKQVNAASIPVALLRKEFRHLLGSAIYMLNCALGALLMIIAAVFIVIKADAIRGLIETLQSSDLGFILLFTPLVIGALGCFVSSMNYLTAPSISLEAKTLWLLKSLPITPEQTFQGKQRMHLLLTIGPSLVLHAAACIVFKLDVRSSIESGALVVLFTTFFSAFGLFMNLKMPNLNWTNEAIAVKQSGSVLISMFGAWIILIAIGAAYALWLIKFIDPRIFLYILITIFLLLTILFNVWLKKRGTKIFASL